MQFFTTFATLATFVAAASAATSFTGNATIFTPGGRVGACGTAVQDSDRAVALPAAAFDVSLCGTVVAIENTLDQFGGEVDVADLCVECQGDDFKLTPFAFSTFLNETEAAAGISEFPAEYATGIFGRNIKRKL